jgi:hypothetical protein
VPTALPAATLAEPIQPRLAGALEPFDLALGLGMERVAVLLRDAQCGQQVLEGVPPAAKRCWTARRSGLTRTSAGGWPALPSWCADGSDALNQELLAHSGPVGERNNMLSATTNTYLKSLCVQELPSASQIWVSGPD